MIKASELERRWIFPLRAAQWKGKLSVEQYLGRNHRLFAHPYAKKIETYLLKDGGEFAASFDALPLPFLVKLSSGEVREMEGAHIASVLTVPAQRGKGHARRLLGEYLVAHPNRLAVLNSGIGLRYYEALGFKANPLPAMVIEVPTSAMETKSTLAISMSQEEFVGALRVERGKRIAVQRSLVAAIPYPTELLIDWHVERYRYFAEAMEKVLPENLFWSLDGSIVAALPDYTHDRLDGFWIPGESAEILSFLHSLARDCGLKSVRYMRRESPLDETLNPDIPMIRAPFEDGASIVDFQLSDVW